MPARDDVLKRLSVSRETAECLNQFVSLLESWQRVKNLVGPRTLDDLWVRHIEDSAQIVPLLGDRRVIADLGSGAGFPGLVIAILNRSVPGFRMHLVESNSRKCAFLREVSRKLGLPVQVHCSRIEDALPLITGLEAITARALASLSDLLALTNHLLKGQCVGIFPKGQDVERELTEASKYWTFTATTVASRTDSKARIVLVRDARPASL